MSWNWCHSIFALSFYWSKSILDQHKFFWTLVKRQNLVINDSFSRFWWLVILQNETPCFLLLSVMRVCLNVSTTPITAMECRQCLPFSAIQLKAKHCRKPHCHNGVIDTFGLCMLGACSQPAHVRTCLVYVTRNLSTKNIFCQQKKEEIILDKFMQPSYSFTLGMENIFWSLQNYLNQKKIFWSWPKSGLDV